jgi:hypothetical protein
VEGTVDLLNVCATANTAVKNFCIKIASRHDYLYWVGLQDPTSPPYPLGTGLSAMQLSWVPDAYCLNEDGLPTPIGSTALELMTQRGIR